MRHQEIQDLWFRNSFIFNYWKFLKSDIDITVVFKKANPELIQKVSKTHAFIRKFIPVIGELVIYSQFHSKELLECINSYELSRDPILKKKNNLYKPNEPFERIVFLHKFIIANWTKKDIDSARSEKVRYYTTLLDINDTPNFNQLLDNMVVLIGTHQEPFKTFYKEIADSLGEFRQGTLPNLIYCLFYNQFCYLTLENPLSEIEKKILEKILLWELWGCFSYQATISNRELQNHFMRIIEKLDILISPEFCERYIRLCRRLELMD